MKTTTIVNYCISSDPALEIPDQYTLRKHVSLNMSIKTNAFLIIQTIYNIQIKYM